MSEFKKLTLSQLQSYEADFNARPDAKIIARTVMKNGIKASSEDQNVSQRNHRVFSYEVKTGKVCNQRHSGRCWSFAALNTLRHLFANQYHFKDFELSQNYLFFWDRVERANMFLQNIIATASLPFHDRLVDFYVAFAENDGGQWANAASIIEKYGVVPEYAMPDTYNTKNTDDIAAVMKDLMHKDALVLRKMINEQHADQAEVLAAKEKMVSEVYRLAVYAFGMPPKRFDLEFEDDDHKLHRQSDLSPLEFFHQYWQLDLRDYVVLTNAPDHELNQVYSMPQQDSVVGGIPIQFVNVAFDQLQKSVVSQLKAGETVWVGNDVLQQMDRKRGIMDAKLYHQEELLGIDYVMDKKERLETRQACVSHAMTLTGFNEVDGQIDRWKIENSWGEENGEKGYFVMTQKWFEDYTYEAVINKKYLSDELKQLSTKKPVQLTAWDSLQ